MSDSFLTRLDRHLHFVLRAVAVPVLGFLTLAIVDYFTGAISWLERFGGPLQFAPHLLFGLPMGFFIRKRFGDYGDSLLWIPFAGLMLFAVSQTSLSNWWPGFGLYLLGNAQTTGDHLGVLFISYPFYLALGYSLGASLVKDQPKPESGDAAAPTVLPRI